MFHYPMPNVGQSSRSTYLLASGRLAKRTDGDSHEFRILSMLPDGVLLFSLIHRCYVIDILITWMHVSLNRRLTLRVI